MIKIRISNHLKTHKWTVVLLVLSCKGRGLLRGKKRGKINHEEGDGSPSTTRVKISTTITNYIPFLQNRPTYHLLPPSPYSTVLIVTSMSKQFSLFKDPMTLLGRTQTIQSSRGSTPRNHMDLTLDVKNKINSTTLTVVPVPSRYTGRST